MKKKILTSIGIITIILLLAFQLDAQTESKVAVLTVSGSGKTQDEAKQNALRNAIEQAFGAFISSNTQILNDQLVKDDIVSVSNGNIQEYNVISEVQTPDGSWSNTIRAKVSIDKLTSFCASKGVNVEFKGALFSLNIKQQELSAKNEEVALENMCNVLKQLQENCFDYEIKAGEPKASGHSDKKWAIPIEITAIPNNNLKTLSEYFCSTINGISMNQSERTNFEQLGKKTYSIMIESHFPNNELLKSNVDNNGKRNSKRSEVNSNSTNKNLQAIIFRNKKSKDIICDFLYYFRKTLLNFKIVNDLDTKIGNDFVSYRPQFSCSLRVSDFGFSPYFIQFDPNKNTQNLSFITIREGNDRYLQPYCDFEPYRHEIHSYHGYGGALENEGDILSFKDIPIGKKVITLTYTDYRTTDEISKLSGYKIMFCKNKFDRIALDQYQNYSYKAVSENPEDSYDAQIQLGIVGYNKAVELYNIAANLYKAQPTSDETAKYRKAKEDATAEALNVIPIAERARALNPAALDPLNLLLNIYTLVINHNPNNQEYRSKFAEITKIRDDLQKNQK